MIAKEISYYRIEEELGRGGMGVVYKAVDTRLHRTVALKFLPPNVIDDSEARDRFLREARVAASIEHPNICTIFDVGYEEEQVFLAMAFYEGVTLDRAIGGEPMEMDRALAIARQIAQGLSAAHKRGVVHRDVKPGNIMLLDGDLIKVLDFGLAKLQTSSTLTAPGTAMGTPFYMSPEQATGTGIDARTDIWAFGVVLYELLTGVCPFRRDYGAAVVYSILNETPPAASTINPSIPAYIDALIANCLAKKRDDRTESMDAVLEALGSDDGLAGSGARVHMVPDVRHDTDYVVDRVFVGRASEVATVRNALTAVQSGSGSTVLIRGEAGIGKTHLVAQTIAATEPTAVIWGRAQPHERDIPYHAFVRGFRSSVKNIAQLLSNENSIPTELRPKLAHLRQLVDPTVDASRLLNKEQLWDAVLSFLRYVTDHTRKLIIVLDDLHWADRPSIGLFAFLSRSIGDLPILLIGILRDDKSVTSDEESRHLVDTIRQLNIEKKIVSVTVERLDFTSSSSLVDELLPGGTVNPAVRKLVHKQTEGHPMFIAETVHLMRDRGALEVVDGVWQLSKSSFQALSQRINDVILQRLDRLNRHDRTVLDAASCQGETFESEQLLACVNADRLDLLRTLQSLEADHGLVRRSGDGYRFDHGMVKHVLYDALLPELRKEYHRLIADSLLEHHGDDDRHARNLANHLSLCGRDREAVPFVARAAARARGLHAIEDARDLYLRLDALIKQHEPELDRFAPEVSEGLGDVLSSTGETAEAVDHYRRFIEYAKSADDQRGRIRGLLGISECHRITGALDNAETACHDALVAATAIGDNGAEAAVRHELSLVYASRGAYEKAVEESLRSHDLFEKENDARGQSLSMSSIGFAYWHMGKYQQAMEYLTKALDLQRRIGDRKGLARTLNFLGLGYWKLGEFEKALVCTHESVDIKESISDTRVIPGSLNLIGDLLREIYRPEEALRYHERSIRLARKHENKGATCDNLRDIGADYLMMGDLGSALDYFEEALATAEEAGIGWYQTRACISLASVHLELGEPEVARAFAARGLALAQQLGADELLTEALWSEANVAARSGKLEAAEPLFEDAIQRARKLGYSTILWQIYADYATMLEKAGAADRAMECFDDSRRILNDIVARFSDDDLRSSFVGSTRVVEILNTG